MAKRHEEMARTALSTGAFGQRSVKSAGDVAVIAALLARVEREVIERAAAANCRDCAAGRPFIKVGVLEAHSDGGRPALCLSRAIRALLEDDDA